MSTKAHHVIVKWNAGSSFEPNTIAVHAAILAKHPAERPYVWWGKLSKTGKLGMVEADVLLLQQQIANGIETHLYAYCPDKNSSTLHVGLVQGVQQARPADNDRIPDYYNKLAYAIPFWFQLADLRELTIEHLDHLVLSNGQRYDPVAVNAYPLLVNESREIWPFDYSHPGATKWHLLQRLHEGHSTAPNIDPSLVFVLMPFSDEFVDVWKLGIQPTVEGLGLTCRRADEFLHNKDIMDVIRENIRSARLIVADMSTNNPNVFYELGYAHALAKPVLLVTRDRSVVPFDLRGINNIEYKHAADLVTYLPPFIKSILQL